MKKYIKYNRVYFIFSICILLLTIFIVKRIMQNDTFFTIRIGNDVFQNGMTRVDNLTIHDNIEFIHLRWAFDAVISIIYNLFDFKGIYIFVIIISSIITLSLFNVLINKNNNIILSFLLTIFTIVAVNSYFTGRAQIISYLVFLIEIYLIEKVVENENNNKYIAILLLLPVILANFHASVLPMYFILILPYIAENIIFKIIKIFKKSLNDKSISIGKIEIKNISIDKLLIIIPIAALLGLLSPSFVDAYTYMFKCTFGASSYVINELQNITFTKNIFVWIIYTVFILLLLVKDTKVRLCDLFMIFGLGIMAFLAARNAAFFYIITPICVSRLIQSSAKLSDIFVKITDIINKKIIILVILLIVFIIICSILYFERKNEKFINENAYPVKASEYILENIDTANMRLYNHLNFGSYLELKNIPVFIDSRTEIFCLEFNPNAILIEWDMVKSGRIHYNDLFEKYNITHVLLYKNEIIQNYIKYDSNYNEIYSDNNFVLYENKKCT